MTIPQSNPLTDDQLNRLEQYLRQNATADAVTTDELANHLDIEDDHDTNPTIRQAVQYLLHDGRLCVEGTNKGYVVHTDEDGRAEAIDSLREHIGTLNRRVQSLKTAPLANDDADSVECHICGDEIPVGRAHEPTQGEYAGESLCESDFGTLVMDSDSSVSRDTATAPNADSAPSGPTCERCGAGIEGDPYLWFSVELCRDCYDAKPPSEEAFRDWVEAGADA
jgi:hypothetical protein